MEYQKKTFIRKLERVLIKLYRQNVYLLFNQTCLNERLLPNYTHIYVCVCVCVCVCVYEREKEREREREREREKYSLWLI